MQKNTWHAIGLDFLPTSGTLEDHKISLAIVNIYETEK